VPDRGRRRHHRADAGRRTAPAESGITLDLAAYTAHGGRGAGRAVCHQGRPCGPRRHCQRHDAGARRHGPAHRQRSLIEALLAALGPDAPPDLAPGLARPRGRIELEAGSRRSRSTSWPRERTRRPAPRTWTASSA
jgi:hypothetical protein